MKGKPRKIVFLEFSFSRALDSTDTASERLGVRDGNAPIRTRRVACAAHADDSTGFQDTRRWASGDRA